MKLKDALKLTPLQWDILYHRLQVPDAILESLKDERYNEDDLKEVIGYLADGALERAEHLSTEITSAVLDDLITESTWLCSMEDNATARDLSEKMSNYLGHKVVMSLH